MLGHTLFHSSSIRWATPLVALALLGPQDLSAALITQTVEFSTTNTSGANQLGVTGTLDTLAQGLREVPFGATTVGTQGTLQAELTFETSAQEPPVLVGVKFLENSFNQNAVTLFYDVPGTSRRVTFTASDVKFSLDFKDIVAEPPVEQPPSNLLAALVDVPGVMTMHPNSYQMVQNNGMSQINITNRPPRQQNLLEQQVFSAYVGQQPDPNLELARFAIMPIDGQSSEYLVSMSVPLAHQQVHYSGVGLPVTLDYAGSLELTGLVPIINNSVPEPSALILATFAAVGSVLRRGRGRS